MGEDHARSLIREFDVRDDLVGTTSRVDGDAFANRGRARVVHVPLAWRLRRWPLHVEYLQHGTVVERQDKIFVRLFKPQLFERLQLLGMLFG
jgi:hypothetical protein